MARRRVYCETLAHRELVRPRVLSLVERYGVELVLAVRPHDLAGLSAVAGALGERGVPLSIWPMLDDEDGRWANVHNAEAFGAHALAACDALHRVSAAPLDVLLDLEPPIAAARALASLATRGGGRRRLAQVAEALRSSRRGAAPGAASLARTIAEIHARGLTTSLAVVPLVALDAPGEDAWQLLLGTPVDLLSATHVSVMMYTSMLEGWSRGAVRRTDAIALLAAASARSAARWGSSAGISLGCVGPGALETEPVYRDPSELAEDVAVARAAGCDDLSLFDLGGVLARGPAEAWLDAFTATPPGRALGAPTRRVRLGSVAARAATWPLRRLRGRARAYRA